MIVPNHWEHKDLNFKTMYYGILPKGSKRARSEGSIFFCSFFFFLNVERETHWENSDHNVNKSWHSYKKSADNPPWNTLPQPRCVYFVTAWHQSAITYTIRHFRRHHNYHKKKLQKHSQVAVNYFYRARRPHDMMMTTTSLLTLLKLNPHWWLWYAPSECLHPRGPSGK